MDPREHERQAAFDHQHKRHMDGLLFSVIEQYGIHFDADTLSGCPDAPWHIHLPRTTVFGKSVREVAQRAFDELRKRGEI
jgi:hypothetical protein